MLNLYRVEFPSSCNGALCKKVESIAERKKSSPKAEVGQLIYRSHFL